MAAAAEEEGGQSDRKNGDYASQETSKHISTIHQEIESQLERSGVSYETRVHAVLSGWDHLAGFVHGDSSQVQPLASFLYRWSLKLILQGQWPSLAQIVKTRLAVTLQRCSNVPVFEPLCRILIPLVNEPWGHQTKTILSDEAEITDEEAVEYIRNETWDVVRVRVDTMVESRCEKLALLVLRVCVRCIHLRSEGVSVPLYTDEDHNHFVDLYFALLYRFERKEFVEEVKRLEVSIGVDLVRRLMGKQDKLKIWKHRLKIADLAIQIILATTIVKTFSHVFETVFQEWCNVQECATIEDSVLLETIRKYIQLSESSKHVYTMARVLHDKFGSRVASLVTELLIRALTTDMNSLEALKLKSEEELLKENQLKMEHQMAKGFMDLASVFTQHKNVARECILTAFSLHPTSERLTLVSNYTNERSPRAASVNSGVTKTSATMVEKDGEIACAISTDKRDSHGQNLSSFLSHDDDRRTPNIHTQHWSREEGNNEYGLNVSMDSGREREESEDISDIDGRGYTRKVHIEGNKEMEESSNLSNNCSQSHSSFHLKDSPAESECVSIVTLDTGQKLSAESPPPSNTLESQMHIISGDAQRLRDDVMSQTKDITERSIMGISEDSVPSEYKGRDDLDSMDKFYKSTESFIKQLREEPPKKSAGPCTEDFQNYDILTQPNQVLDSEELGLPKELCDDLAVVLSSPRWQVLSWVLDRHELLGICERYLHDVDSAKNITKELKYLNIDYSQFKHMPSAEINEFTGIEKGYEHFIEYESESEISEGEYCQGVNMNESPHSGTYVSDSSDYRKDHIEKGNLNLTHTHTFYDSDSEYDSIEKYGPSSRYLAPSSDSDDSDFNAKRNKTVLLKMDRDSSGIIEGKRVTAVSIQDRSKRIRIDAGTGKIRPERLETDFAKVRRERSLMNSLRLFRHKQIFEDTKNDLPKFEPRQQAPSQYCPRLSSDNLRPSVVLTEREKSIMDQQIQRGAITVMAGKKPAQTSSIPSSQSRGSWIYAGSLVAPPNSASAIRAATPVSVPYSASSQCYLRTKDGKVRVAPLHRGSFVNCRQPYPEENVNNNSNNLKGSPTTPSSGYHDSYTKFLMRNNKKSSVTLMRKPLTLDASLDYLKKQGTTVIFKSQKGDSTHALASAQKNVLNRIMSPENALAAMRGRFNDNLPVRAIAMPVSNNMPNMPPIDKNSPSGLSRVLPKGTTVVRKPKADGAGPSGLNNGGPSSGNVAQRTVIARPAHFTAVVARPSVTITNQSVRSGNSVMAVRTNSTAIRAPISRTVAVAVTGGSGGGQDSSNTNRQSVSPIIVSSPSTSSIVVTSASVFGSGSNAMPAPLASATVVGSVPNFTNSNLGSPMGTLGGTNGQQPWENALDESVSDSPLSGETSVSITTQMSTTRGATTCTTTVASPPGDVRAASMLETLLRDRPVPASPIQSQSTTATTTITAALPQTLTSIVGGTSIPVAVSGEGQVAGAVMGALTNAGSSGSSVVFASGSNNNSGVIVASGVVGGSGSGVVVASGGVVSNTGIVTAGSNAVGDGSSGTVQQVLVPGQLVHVHTSDGSTGLGIVHSSSLDLRLSAGTRVIKSNSGPVRTTTASQHQVMGVINQTPGRQVNVLHNVKILQNVQNRQIVRTVVVPHSVAVQSPHLKPQLVALSQGTSTSASPASATAEATVVQGQGQASTVRTKIPSSTIVQKVLGRSGLVIRTIRPQVPVSQVGGETSSFEEGLGAKLQQQQQNTDEDKTGSIGATVVARLPQDEGLGERLSHYLKTALVSSTSTQSVGTQTLTTAVKPSAGQVVNQVAMNHLRGTGAAVVSLSGGIVQGIVSNVNVAAGTGPTSQQGGLSLPLTPTNAVSSETLEQLREFESVFEKVSNKSGKDSNEGVETNVETYSSTTASSEESMIAAQLLSMANDTPAVTTSNYVYSVPASVYEAGSTRLSEGTYITIPSSTQTGTLILVNHSGSSTGLVTVAGGVQSQQQQQQQPPTAPSPTLSSTSSHSSVASSPSSTSSKNKKQPPKAKVAPPSTPPAVTKPKTPPPPKAPAPKPTVAKPQVEESDEIKARIQSILEQYKQDLANTPQPQPAPRNRKNCPPPKGDGKSSSKKKSGVKKMEGSAGNSPAVSEGSVAGCPSPSPSPGPTSESSVGLSGNTSGVATVQFCNQGLQSQVVGPTGGTVLTEDKIKVENSIKVEPGSEVIATAGSQLLQGVMVSNVKVEAGGMTGGNTSLPQSLAGGRVVQLIRHGGKVTAITTRQPLSKIKTAGQGGPPPNVTIQGRINMNDLMDSHIASLLTGGTSTITQTPTVVSKIIQQQTIGHPTVQQVVVQPSAGPQVLQHVSVQQIPSTPPKAHQQPSKCGVIQQLSGNENLLGLTTPPRSVHVNIPALSASVTPLSSSPSISNVATHTNTQTVVKSPGISSTPGPSPLSVAPSSPLTPQGIPVTSPTISHPPTASPHTLSPGTEQPPTPSSFQMGDESNSSEQSVGEGSTGPLPPFFTLKSFIMQQPQQHKQRSQAQQSHSQEQQQRLQNKNFSPGTVGEQTLTAEISQAATPVINISSPNKAQRGNQTHMHSLPGHLQRKPSSVIRTGGAGGRILVTGLVEGSDKRLVHGTSGTPLLISGTGDAVVPISPISGSSSLENSPASGQSRIRLASRPQDMRSSSIDSLKSDLSVEEVQIPPSPATLTKQLQNAYMAESALSPSVSQSQHSGSSYSSPGTAHDMTFSEAPPTSDDSFSATLSQPCCSSAPSTQGLSVSGVSLEGDSALAALTSPSGDIYLHQSGAGLGLDGLENASLPLVAGMEVRTHSPALSDLVSSGPLLTWSPRSADSMMAQSPSLNDALTANIPLDGNHSEDSLCDSSTGFPGLFSMEGDGVSVSSSTSEDIASVSLGPPSGNQQQSQERQESMEIAIDLNPQESEQDHTISSTRSPTQLELPVGSLRIPDRGNEMNVDVPVNTVTQDTPWRFEGQNTSRSQPSPDAKDEQKAEVKPCIKQEDYTSASNDTGAENLLKQPALTRPTGKNVKSRESDGVKIKDIISNDDIKEEKDTPDMCKKSGRGTDAVKRNSAIAQGNKKRSNRLASLLEGKKGVGNETSLSEDVKNGHESNIEKSEDDCSVITSRSRRRSSQRSMSAYPAQNLACRNRSKGVKSEEGKNDEDADYLDACIKEEKPFAKTEKEVRDGCDDPSVRLKESCEETMGRTTRGSKRRSEGEVIADIKRGRNAKAGRRSDGDIMRVEEDVNHLEEDCSLSRTLRGRHISGTSDTSSNYSMERPLTPGLHDSPGISSSNTRRRRRLSRESSASSRDGSPTLLHTHDFLPGGINTRRSSSRDHAKKKKCSCCIGGGELRKSGTGNNSRRSPRSTRASHSSTV